MKKMVKTELGGMDMTTNKKSIFHLVFVVLIVYCCFISYSYFFNKENVKEYEFNFSTEELALTNFDILVGNGFIYIPASYYFEKQTDKEISGYRLELHMNDEVVFEFNTGEPFKKYDHTLPGISKIIHENASENSNIKLKLIYTIDGVEYKLDEAIKLNN